MSVYFIPIDDETVVKHVTTDPENQFYSIRDRICVYGPYENDIKAKEAYNKLLRLFPAIQDVITFERQDGLPLFPSLVREQTNDQGVIVAKKKKPSAGRKRR